MKNLLIIADDLGLHKSVNNGIIFLLKRGKINGASLMANGKAFDHAVKLITTDTEPRITTDGEPRITADSELNIGIHFVLVDEKSLSNIKLPKSYKEFSIKYVLGLIKLSDIEIELRVQIDKIIKAGIRPTFINSHQHLHLLPGITDIVIKLAKEYGIPYIRVVTEPIAINKGVLFRQAQLCILNFLSEIARTKIKKSKLECNDYFIGFTNAGNLKMGDISYARELTQQYPDKVIELGSHPGFDDEDLRDRYNHWDDYNWQKELELISNIQ